MKKQIHIFLTAIMFYTRIPCPSWVDHREEYLNKATIYFPIIGWIVGAVGAIVAIFFNTLFYVAHTEGYHFEIVAIMSTVATIMLTGAFHEDGFADVCDGFGGGWTREKILEIMKDSRVGAYALIGTILLLSLKIFTVASLCLNYKNSWIFPFLFFINAHTLSRTTALTVIFTDAYARENDLDGKAKPVAKHLSNGEFLVALFFGLLPFFCLLYYTKNYDFVLIFLPLLVVRWYMVTKFRKWLGGYTGDCLGAVQQVSEVVVYLSFLIFA